uniref:Uncharacterized protein n=1 Tax=Aegilops tauschii subsp. strangulata TaxID=200361 RepID=A0A453FRG8_AEGTS
MLRTQLNKPWKQNTHSHTATRATSLIGLRRRGRQQGRHVEGHRAKVGEKGVDGVPVLGAAKRPPELSLAARAVGSSSTCPRAAAPAPPPPPPPPRNTRAVREIRGSTSVQ